MVCHLQMLVLSHSVVSDSLQPHGNSPPVSSVHGDAPGKNTGVGCHALLQGIFPIQGWNPGFLHHRRILYCLATREDCLQMLFGASFFLVESEVDHRSLPPNPHCSQKHAQIWEIYNLPKCIIIIVIIIIFIPSSFFPSKFNVLGHTDRVKNFSKI